LTTAWPATILGGPLIGRREEVRRAVDLLNRPGVRLVSVTGAGGVGKTRVAFEVVGEHSGFDPAIVVGLAAATEPSQLLGLVAESLGIRADSSAAASDRIAAVLASRSDPVLVIDNVEHLLSAVPEALGLLDRCPTLRILVTTRRALNVPGEHVIELHGLPAPDSEELDWREIGCADAVQLFVDRASAVQPGFALTPLNAWQVAEVCRRVGGLPLAVELAAARCATLPMADLAASTGTASLLDATDSNSCDRPVRQQSLRACLSWSYHLLTDTERALLRQTSVFVGPFSLDDVAEVALGAGAASMVDTFESLSVLVDLYLVELDRTGREPVFQLSAPVREFARAAAVDCGEFERLANARRDHVTAIARAAAEAYATPGERRTVARLERCRADVIAVIGEFVAAGSVGEALAVLADAGGLWFRAGFYTTEADWLHGLLERAGDVDVPPATLASALLWSANLMCDRILTDDERRHVLAHLASGSRLATRVGDDRLRLRANLFEARIATYLRDDERALRAVTAGLARARQLRLLHWQAALLCWGALASQQQGEHDRAMEMAMQALVLAERLGEPSITVRTALVLDSLPREFAPRVARVPTLEELLELARQADDVSCEAWVLARLAYRDVRRGDVASALEWASLGLGMTQRNNWWHVAGFCTMSLVAVAASRSEWMVAAQLHGGLGHVISTSGSAIAPAQVDSYTTEVAQVRAGAGARFDEWASAAAARSFDENLTAAMSYARGVLATLVDQVSDPVPCSRSAASLTPRELQVVGLLASGASNKDIARTLGVRPKTIMHHSVAIYRKLGVRGRTEAAVWAIHEGLGHPGHLPD
jgi:predicted ATPase/DNA-binding CsgD family transcriptional regulator